MEMALYWSIHKEWLVDGLFIGYVAKIDVAFCSIPLSVKMTSYNNEWSFMYQLMNNAKTTFQLLNKRYAYIAIWIDSSHVTIPLSVTIYSLTDGIILYNEAHIYQTFSWSSWLWFQSLLKTRIKGRTYRRHATNVEMIYIFKSGPWMIYVLDM